MKLHLLTQDSSIPKYSLVNGINEDTIAILTNNENYYLAQHVHIGNEITALPKKYMINTAIKCFNKIYDTDYTIDTIDKVAVIL